MMPIPEAYASGWRSYLLGGRTPAPIIAPVPSAGEMEVEPGRGVAAADLQRFTDAALAHLVIDDLLAELLERITVILHSATAAFLLLEPNGEMLRARAAKGIEEEVEQGVRLPLGGGFAGRVASERHPIFIPDTANADIL